MNEPDEMWEKRSLNAPWRYYFALVWWSPATMKVRTVLMKFILNAFDFLAEFSKCLCPVNLSSYIHINSGRLKKRRSVCVVMAGYIWSTVAVFLREPLVVSVGWFSHFTAVDEWHSCSFFVNLLNDFSRRWVGLELCVAMRRIQCSLLSQLILFLNLCCFY